MNRREALITEIEQEAAKTQKILERIPTDKFDWKPHEKSMSLKQLASHIASLTGIVSSAANQEYLDLAENRGNQGEIATAEDIVNRFNAGTEQSLKALKSIEDNKLDEEWTMRAGDHVIMQAPRSVAIRTMGLSHLYHHRGQLGVYLRLLNVPVPGMYGPSADDKAGNA